MVLFGFGFFKVKETKRHFSCGIAEWFGAGSCFSPKLNCSDPSLEPRQTRQGSVLSQGYSWRRTDQLSSQLTEELFTTH